MRTLNEMLWLYQKSGLQKVVQRSRILNVVPGNLATMEKVIPNVSSPKEMRNRPRHIKPKESVKKRVAFFSGCLMDTMFMKTNDSTFFLLEKVGCEIIIPESQNCCGALHAHSGEKDKARHLAKMNILAFEKLDVDYIISNAGGCGALLVEYDHLLKDEPDWYRRAKAFSNKVKDISAVLLEIGLPKMKLPEQIITYQDSCHLRNVMNVCEQPRKLLRIIEGVTYEEMKESDRCCGSAGVYNLIQPEMSTQIIDHKMVHVKASKAATIVTANPGCLLQMKLGVEREGLSHTVRSVHIVDLLAEAVHFADGETSE